jgi:hypothetical protein
MFDMHQCYVCGNHNASYLRSFQVSTVTGMLFTGKRTMQGSATTYADKHLCASCAAAHDKKRAQAWSAILAFIAALFLYTFWQGLF